MWCKKIINIKIKSKFKIYIHLCGVEFMKDKLNKFNLYVQQVKKQLEQDAGITVGSVMGPTSADNSLASTIVDGEPPVVHKDTQGVTVSDVKAIYTPAINKVKVNKRKLKK